MNARSAKSCGNCEHFGALELVCRRKSPVPMLMGVQANGEPVIIGAQPPTRSERKCGEWEATVVVM